MNLTGTKRQRIGYAQNSFNVNSGSNNVVNARPLMTMIEANKAKSNPLFPHYEFHSQQYSVVFRGEIAFKPMNVSRHGVPYPGAELQGGFSDTIDSVGYLPALNGLGHETEKLPNESRSEAQRRWRHKISVIGPSFTTIQAEPNLFNQGNTIITGKGKMSIPNTGTEEIKDGEMVCWDICTDDDYPNSGIPLLNFEKGRRSLLVRPARTDITTMDGIYEAVMSNQYWDANTEERKARFHFVKGLIEIASAVAPIVASEYSIASSSDKFSDFMRGSVILSLDDSDLTTNEREYVRMYSTINSTKPDLFTEKFKTMLPGETVASYNSKKIQTFKKITKQMNEPNPEPENYIDSFITKFQGLSINSASTTEEKIAYADVQLYDSMKATATSTGINVLKNILPEGIYDLMLGLTLITHSEQKRLLGQAVTPASKGRDFDLVLHM